MDTVIDPITKHQVRHEDDRYNCAQCHCLLRNAYQTDCGCFLCEQCVLKLFEIAPDPSTRWYCPGATSVCVELNRDMVRPDIAKRREINRLSLKCPFSTRCTAVVPVPDLAAHYDTCGFVEVPCENCQQVVVRSELQAHYMQVCPAKYVLCPHCCQSYSREYLVATHLNTQQPECSKFVFVCRFCNEEGCTAASISNHSKVCNAWLEPCKFRQYGCKEELSHEAMQEHYASNMVNHLRLLCQCLLKFGENTRLICDYVERAQQLTCSANETEEFNNLIDSIEQMTQQLVPETNINLNSGILLAMVDQLTRIKSLNWVDGLFVWKITDFRQKRAEAQRQSNWCLMSDSFYSKQGFGYRFRLRLYPNGKDSGEGRFLSVYFQLMPGVFDDMLAWPFNQCVKIQLLHRPRSPMNKVEFFRPIPSSMHYQRSSLPDGSPPCGSPTFIELDALENTFLHSDSLFITCEIVEIT